MADSSPAPSDPDSPYLFRLNLKRADMIVFRRDIAHISPAAAAAWERVRRSYRASVASAAVFAAALVALVCILGLSAVGDRPIIAGILGCGALASMMSAARYRAYLAPLARAEDPSRQPMSDGDRYHLGPQTLTVGPDGISHSLVHHDTVQRWSGITDIREGYGGVYLVRQDRACYIVPRRLFSSPDEATSFVARCRAWLDAAGHGDSRRLRDYLAKNDAPCPACQYNLRGVTTRVCPECGCEFDVSLIRPSS